MPAGFRAMARHGRFTAIAAPSRGRNCAQALPTNAARRYDARPFDDGPRRRRFRSNNSVEVFFSRVLTVPESDVEWAAHPGRKVTGAITERVIGQEDL